MTDSDKAAKATRRRTLSPVLDAEKFQTLSSAVRVEFGAMSQRGSLRPHNDDHYLAIRLARSQAIIATSLASSDLPENFQEQAFAFLVADGLGDRGVGSLASRIALSTFAHLALHFGQWNVRIDGFTAEQVMDRAKRFYERINDAVLKRGQANPDLRGMATTLRDWLTHHGTPAAPSPAQGGEAPRTGAPIDPATPTTPPMGPRRSGQ